MNMWRAFIRDYAWEIVLGAGMVILCGLSLLVLHPTIGGDSPSYLEAMRVMSGGHTPIGFVPNRILTTFGGVILIPLIAPLFGGTLHAWLAMNIFFFFMLGYASFLLFRSLFGSAPVALLGAFFVIANYAPMVFGLAYLMDIGGWAFFMAALLFVYRYLEDGSFRTILCAALLTGIGTVFKEYAALASIAITCAVAYRAYPSLAKIEGALAPAGALAFALVAPIHLYVYMRFGYTYLDWTAQQHAAYDTAYASRLIEYIKAGGALLNLLAPLALAGMCIAYRRALSGELPANVAAFIIACAVSIVPIFFWPGITERVLYVGVPLAALFACFLFYQFRRTWYVFLPLLALYAGASVVMDSVILRVVNLPF